MAALIPEGHRLCELPSVVVKDRASLKDALDEYLELSDLKIRPLTHLCARWNSYAARYDTSVNILLRELAAEGRCAVKYFQELNRTYVLAASNYADILADEAAGTPVDWNKYAESIRDIK